MPHGDLPRSAASVEPRSHQRGRSARASPLLSVPCSSAPIAPGGPLHQAHEEVLDWVARYDTGGPKMRSRAMHEAWLAGLACPVVRLEGDLTPDEQIRRIVATAGSPTT